MAEDDKDYHRNAPSLTTLSHLGLHRAHYVRPFLSFSQRSLTDSLDHDAWSISRVYAEIWGCEPRTGITMTSTNEPYREAG